VTANASPSRRSEDKMPGDVKVPTSPDCRPDALGMPSKPVRIVTPWYGTFAGGAEYAARSLAQQLLKAGARVAVLTTCSRSPYHDWWRDELTPGWCRINEVPVCRFPVNTEPVGVYHRLLPKVQAHQKLNRAEQLTFMRGTINSHALIAHLKKQKDHSISVFLPYLYGPTFWGLRALRGNAVMIPCLHDEDQAHWQEMKAVVQQARQIVFLSPEEKQLAQELFGEGMAPMPVLGLGVDTQAQGQADRFRAKYNIRRPFVLYAGRKDPGKNVSQLIDYFGDYRRQSGVDLGLVFIGGGDPTLVPNDRREVMDLGFVPEQEKQDAMRAALAICNLSEMESFSLVVMEAWLQRRPVIVSDRCRVTRGHCLRCDGGFAVDSSESFCRAVDRMMTKPEMAMQLGRNGQRYVECQYTWPTLLPRYLQAFNEVG
jgi:glycosyltransferase involved in cell wall biosynthesis